MKAAVAMVSSLLLLREGNRLRTNPLTAAFADEMESKDCAALKASTTEEKLGHP